MEAWTSPSEARAGRAAAVRESAAGTTRCHAPVAARPSEVSRLRVHGRVRAAQSPKRLRPGRSHSVGISIPPPDFISRSRGRMAGRGLPRPCAGRKGSCAAGAGGDAVAADRVASGISTSHDDLASRNGPTGRRAGERGEPRGRLIRRGPGTRARARWPPRQRRRKLPAAELATRRFSHRPPGRACLAAGHATTPVGSEARGCGSLMRTGTIEVPARHRPRSRVGRAPRRPFDVTGREARGIRRADDRL